MSSRFITQIKLVNFQDHKESTIDLENGINLIVGSSDAGKSAILRAINFVFHNNLKGDSFIRHGSSECSVSVKFSDGVEVTRIKGGDVNSYLLTDTEGNNHSFPKVGTSVPEEIKKHLGQPPLDDKKRPISYADQMSNLFLVDLSPTDLPRTLSELTGIQNLQTAAEALSKNARSFDRVIKDKNDKIEKLNAELENYSYVPKDLEAIEDIESKLTDINLTIAKTNNARAFIVNNNKIAQEANSVKKKIQLETQLFKLDKKFKSVQDLHSKQISSKQILKEYKTIAENFNNLKAEIKKLQLFVTDENKAILTSLNISMSKNKKASDFESLANENKEEQKSLVQLIKNEKTFISQSKDELQRLIDELKTQGNWCNTCNRPLI